jgi:hypothetical protein
MNYIAIHPLYELEGRRADIIVRVGIVWLRLPIFVIGKCDEIFA